MPITEEKKLYLKEYRQRNKKHIAKVSQAKYLRTREDSIAKSRKWQEENKDKMNLRFRKWRKDNPELSRLRAKTRYTFRELKKKSNCKRCGTKEKLEFHHIEPLAYDNFEIVCRPCHMEVHGKLLIRNESCEVVGK